MGWIMIGMDASPITVGIQATAIAGVERSIAVVVAKRDALTMALMVNPGITTLARAMNIKKDREGDKSRRISLSPTSFRW
jgi:hypothetical protein